MRTTSPFLDIATELMEAWLNGSRRSRVALAVGLCLGALAALVAADIPGVSYEVTNYLSAVLGGSGFLLVIAVLAHQRALENSKRAEEIEKIEQQAQDHPEKPKPAWDLARVRLEEYVDKNLRQVTWIFVLVVVIVVIGFALIGWAVFRAFTENTIEPSILAAASGVVVEFIAATFMVIYKSTMEQARGYVVILERINAVGMSAQLLESIEHADSDVRDSTKAELAKSLLDMYRRAQ